MNKQDIKDINFLLYHLDKVFNRMYIASVVFYSEELDSEVYKTLKRVSNKYKDKEVEKKLKEKFESI